MLRDKGMKSEFVWEFEYRLLLSEKDPLAHKADLCVDDLSGYMGAVPRRPVRSVAPMSDIKKAELNEDVTKRIYLYSRGSQLDLLSCVPNTYMWVFADRAGAAPALRSVSSGRARAASGASTATSSSRRRNINIPRPIRRSSISSTRSATV